MKQCNKKEKSGCIWLQAKLQMVYKITKFKSAKYLNQKRRKCTMKRSNKSIRKNNTSTEKNEQRAGTY